MVTNKQLIFVQEPQGLPVEGQDMRLESREIDLEKAPLNGGVLTKVITVSLDPTLRNSMRWTPKPYSKLYEKGQAMWGYGIGEVIRSDKAGWDVGQLVYSRLTGECAARRVAKIESRQLNTHLTLVRFHHARTRTIPNHPSGSTDRRSGHVQEDSAPPGTQHHVLRRCSWYAGHDRVHVSQGNRRRLQAEFVHFRHLCSRRRRP